MPLARRLHLLCVALLPMLLVATQPLAAQPPADSPARDSADCPVDATHSVDTGDATATSAPPTADAVDSIEPNVPSDQNGSPTAEAAPVNEPSEPSDAPAADALPNNAPENAVARSNVSASATSASPADDKVDVEPSENGVADAATPSGDGTQSNDDAKSDDETTGGADPGAPLAGHSYHGEAFNEGPRQAAYLMEGTGPVSFPVQSEHPQVQAFINQGVGQLHGFWYFEAERTFRQAAAFDPQCAAAYWGIAMANTNNRDRAKKFIKQAVERREHASPRVQKYIDALSKLLEAEDEKEGSDDYIAALEEIVYEYPEDIEAKAFIALHLWEGRRTEQKIRSHLAVDALIQQVLDVQPMHPVHHYRIHLWDYEKPERALESSARCGQAAPAIAHMWHMPGHIYSRLHRYPDAVWQQEASARTDHAQMMRDRLLPDQIHNFAHNNEWLIRNLVHVGRIHDALDLAKNMIELPRHPKYNLVTNNGTSAHYGRMRLLQVLREGELWEETLRLAETPILDRTDEFQPQLDWFRAVARANYRLGRVDDGRRQKAELEAMLAEKQAERDALDQPQKDAATDDSATKDKSEEGQPEEGSQSTENPSNQDDSQQDGDSPQVSDSPQDGDSPQDDAKQEAASGSSDAVSPSDDTSDKPSDIATDKPAGGAQKDKQDQDGDKDDAKDENAAKEKDAEEDAEKEKVKESKGKLDGDIRRIKRVLDEIEAYEAALREEWDEAIKRLKEAGEIDHAYLAQLHVHKGDPDKALELLKKQVDSHENETLPLAWLADLQWQLVKRDEARETMERLRALSQRLDRDVRPFARLAPLAHHLGWPEDWRQAAETASDTGNRPPLDQLGPFRWQPTPAPAWSLESARQGTVSLSDYQGRPVVVIFYLGWGCLHCAEQLQAFGPQIDAFRQAGIELVAISSDDAEGLKKSFENYDGEVPFPLLANSELDVFRQYRVYDDFEDQPLHGTFLIDAQGNIRWHDISYEPFMDHAFVLKEAQRLLAQ